MFLKACLWNPRVVVLQSKNWNDTALSIWLDVIQRACLLESKEFCLLEKLFFSHLPAFWYHFSINCLLWRDLSRLQATFLMSHDLPSFENPILREILFWHIKLRLVELWANAIISAELLILNLVITSLVGCCRMVRFYFFNCIIGNSLLLWFSCVLEPANKTWCIKMRFA